MVIIELWTDGQLSGYITEYNRAEALIFVQHYNSGDFDGVKAVIAN